MLVQPVVDHQVMRESHPVRSHWMALPIMEVADLCIVKVVDAKSIGARAFRHRPALPGAEGARDALVRTQGKDPGNKSVARQRARG